jgi:hypothetical protein
VVEGEISNAISKFKEQFVENAQEVLRLQKSANSLEEPSLSESQLSRLGEAKKHIHRVRLPSNCGVTRHSSGEHIVFEVEGLNGLIFKVSKEHPKDLAEVQKYQQLRRDARKLCDEEGLYLIRIPACSFVEIDGVYVIVEERIEDVYGEYHFQKSLYSWGLDQPELKLYFKVLFWQMLIFICKFGFGDCKYNNIPLDQNGRAIFLDLDQWGAEEGLTKGFAQEQNDGLLSYLPQEWLDEAVGEAEHLLGKSLDVEAVRERVAKRTEKREEYSRFAAANGVKEVSDPVVFTRESDEAPQRAAEAFCEEINEKLKESASCDLQIGRRIELDFNTTGSFWKEKARVKGFTKLFGYGRETKIAFVSNVPAALKLLKEKGVIFDYEYKEGSTEAIVYA